MKKVESAFREAGRIVMAILWGVWHADKASIAGKGNSGNGIEYARLTEREEKDLLQLGTRSFNANLERMLGGPVAQAILLGREVVYRGGKGGSEFDTIISVIQDNIPGSSRTEAWAIIHEHEQIVQTDLKRMWPVVEAVAQELGAKHELCDYEIRSIFRTAVNKLPENERIWAISRLRNAPPCS
jgi:hypothetical protein